MQVNWLAPKAGSKLLIVGGCGGIGRSLVESALANDLQVAVFDLARSIEERPLPQGALAFDLDASNVQATDAAMAKLATQWPLLDGLVTLAGFMGQPYPEELFIPEKQEVKSMKHQASGSERNPTAGITRKSFLKLEGFLRKAGVDPTTVCEVRRIGTDDEMVRAIIERIAIGEKTMTYSLPWIAEHEGRVVPVAGLHVVVLDASGSPALLMRFTRVEKLAFGAVDESHIQREGIPMRTMEAWRPLHIDVWNEKLAPFGMTVSDEMPVWAEYFDLIYVVEDCRPALK